MDNAEVTLITRVLYARTVLAIFLAVVIAFTVFFLVQNLKSDSNDALNTILGVVLGSLGTTLTGVGAALARDITEHLERMRSLK